MTTGWRRRFAALAAAMTLGAHLPVAAAQPSGPSTNTAVRPAASAAPTSTRRFDARVFGLVVPRSYPLEPALDARVVRLHRARIASRTILLSSLVALVAGATWFIHCNHTPTANEWLGCAGPQMFMMGSTLSLGITSGLVRAFTRPRARAARRLLLRFHPDLEPRTPAFSVQVGATLR